jgi:drug/metabolite transporter (DMT)-like permease
MRIDSESGAPSRAVIGVAIALLMAIWALNFLVIKVGLRHLPVLTFASFRIVAAGVFMLLIAPVFARLPMFSERGIGSQVTPKPAWTLRDYWVFAYLGFFGVAVNQFCFTAGLRYTNVTHSSIIVGLAPINTLTLAVLFGIELLTWRKASGMAIAFAGVAILALSAGVSHHSPTLLGDAITMCGSLGFSMYVVLGKRVAGKYNPLTMTTWNFIFGALAVLPVAVQQATVADFVGWGSISWQAWLCIAYTGLFSSTLAYLFYFWLLRFLEASQLAAFSYILPVSASGLSIAFLGERGSWMELVGALMALFGLYWIEVGREGRPPLTAESKD